MRARVGLPHIHTMIPGDLIKLIQSGVIKIDAITEKTDGVSFLFGKDQDGFWSQGSCSSTFKMRSMQDYLDRARMRSEETRKPISKGPLSLGMIHEVLSRNPALDYPQVRCEVFFLPMSKKLENGEVKFIGTSYDPAKMGQLGMIILHSKLEDNQNIDPEDFISKGCNDFIFDHDIADIDPIEIDVQKYYDKILSTYRYKEVAEELSSFIDDKIDSMNLKPKWGLETEGYVIHNQNVRFKVTSRSFRKYRDEINGIRNNNR